MYTRLYKKTYAFFASSGEKGGKDTPAKTEPIQEKEKSTGFLGEFGDEIKETFNEITDAPKSKYQAVRETYKILVATGAITDFSNILSLAKRWTEGSGRSGMRAVLKALKDAKNGTISIVTYANNQYDTHSLENYEKIVRGNTSQLNVGIVKGLVHLSQINPSLSLSKETWQEIATYCANRGWNTKIIGNDTELATFMGRNYGEKKLKEEIDLQNIINNELPTMEKTDPRLAELLKANNLDRLPNGNIDLEAAIRKGEIKNAINVPAFFDALAEKLRAQSKELFKKSKELIANSKIRNLKNLELSLGGNADTKDFESLNQSETDKAIPLIKDFLTNLKKTNPEDPRIKDVQNILYSLIARKKAYQSSGDSVNAHTGSKMAQGKIDDAKKQGKPAPSISEIGTTLNSKESQQKITASRNVAIARMETDEAREYLKKFAITDLASAQKELKRLSELGRPLTPEEELIKAGIIGFIESKKKEAQVYITSKSILGEKEAQAIFTESNRFITGSYQETYDFRIIERTGILNDPESTIGEKTLARMKPGETISMSQFVEGDMPTSIMNAPELVSIGVSMNEDGTYNIPLFGAQKITKEQVKEYKENTILYAELGLSQFIPLIPRIISELQRSGHAVSIDGKSSTMEQQILLKELYRLLFGKEITSTNLSEVKHAFSLALGNPTNMKVAMQHTLKIHKLISESSQPIREDVLIEWIRSNNAQDFTNRDFEKVL